MGKKLHRLEGKFSSLECDIFTVISLAADTRCRSSTVHTIHSAVIDESWVHILWYKNMMNQQKRQLLYYYMRIADAHRRTIIFHLHHTFNYYLTDGRTWIWASLSSNDVGCGKFQWNMKATKMHPCEYLRCFKKCRRFAVFYDTILHPISGSWRSVGWLLDFCNKY